MRGVSSNVSVRVKLNIIGFFCPWGRRAGLYKKYEGGAEKDRRKITRGAFRYRNLPAAFRTAKGAENGL